MLWIVNKDYYTFGKRYPKKNNCELPRFWIRVPELASPKLLEKFSVKKVITIYYTERSKQDHCIKLWNKTHFVYINTFYSYVYCKVAIAQCIGGRTGEHSRPATLGLVVDDWLGTPGATPLYQNCHAIPLLYPPIFGFDSCFTACFFQRWTDRSEIRSALRLEFPKKSGTHHTSNFHRPFFLWLTRHYRCLFLLPIWDGWVGKYVFFVIISKPG